MDEKDDIKENKEKSGIKEDENKEKDKENKKEEKQEKQEKEEEQQFYFYKLCKNKRYIINEIKKSMVSIYLEQIHINQELLFILKNMDIYLKELFIFFIFLKKELI